LRQLLFLLATLAMSPAHGNMALAKRNQCMGCHLPDKKVVGPSYREIAARYADQQDAVDVLTRRIRQGSQGIWSPLVMPPNPRISEQDARALAEWILSCQ